MKYERNRDGTGPSGQGPGTGRGKGGCWFYFKEVNTNETRRIITLYSGFIR